MRNLEKIISKKKNEEFLKNAIEIKLINKSEGLVLEAADDYFHLSGSSKSQLNKLEMNDLNENQSEATITNEKIKINQNKLLLRPSLANAKSKHEICTAQVGETQNVSCPLHCVCDCANSLLRASPKMKINTKLRTQNKEMEEVPLNESLMCSKKMEPLTNFDNFNLNFLNELERVLDKQFSPLVRSVMKTLEKHEKRLREKEINEQIQSEWTDLALVSDHFLCFFFPISTLLICLLIFLNSPHFFSQW